MSKLVFLGTSNAVPDENHENTHMAIVGVERLLLIDCANNPIVRLRQANLDVLRLTDLILTHFHPDHVSGTPSLLMSSWLLGRTEPLDIYGLDDTLRRFEKMMDLYEWETWPGFFTVNLHTIPDGELQPVLDAPEFRIFASPVRHLVPAIGLRVEFPNSGKVLAYSSDTEPCDAVRKLAKEADVLVHEATGETLGHTSASQAGEIAAKAGARALYLIHYRSGDFDTNSLVEEARRTFNGPVSLSKDFMELSF